MSDSPPLDIAAQVKSLAKTIGYTACGITSAAPFEEYGRAIDDMIEQLPETRELYEGMRRRQYPVAKITGMMIARMMNLNHEAITPSGGSTHPSAFLVNAISFRPPPKLPV